MFQDDVDTRDEIERMFRDATPEQLSLAHALQRAGLYNGDRADEPDTSRRPGAIYMRQAVAMSLSDYGEPIRKAVLRFTGSRLN